MPMRPISFCAFVTFSSEMQHRAPSSGLARTTIGSSVRRRSSGATAYTEGSGSNGDDSFSATRQQPTISLIARRFSRSQPLPRDQTTISEQSTQVEEEGGYHDYSSISTSDDTSSPELVSRFPGVRPSTSQENASSAQVGLLPSSALLPSFHDVVLTDAHAVDSDDSTGSCQSPGATSTTISVDSGHGGLIPSIGTTDKFTHKWPRPTTLKYFELKPGYMFVHGGTEGAVPTLEEGQGLSLTHIDVAKWTTFKWCLLFSIMTVFMYGCAGLLCAIMTWFNTWDKADVMVVADYDILVAITLSASVLLFTALIGVTGTLLNSRPILAVYTLLLLPSIVSILAVGYMSYKRESFSLDRKLNLSWSRYYTQSGKQVIQDSLHCCGFFNSMHEAAPSKRCYLRTPLPGCKAGLFNFQQDNLRTIWKAAFSLAGLHLLNMAIALLCANHITTSFGKGITPRRYRLSPEDVKADADRILSGLDGYTSPTGFAMEDARKEIAYKNEQ